MSCTSPQSFIVYPSGSGRRAVHLKQGDYFYGAPFGTKTPCGGTVQYLPCGGCLACRIERRQELTILQMAEASLHKYNWFLTLTYDDSIYKYADSLRRWHLSHFFEILRHRLARQGCECRFFGVGEYGDQYGRPHYHATLFGIEPSLLGIGEDKSALDARRRSLGRGKLEFISTAMKDEQGNNYWQSKLIRECWKLGNHMLYIANRETMQYVAGYVVKKLKGFDARKYDGYDMEPPFMIQSRPSIGYPFWKKYRDSLSQPYEGELYQDCLAVGDMNWKIPRIFEKWTDREFPLVDKQLIKDIRTKDCDPAPNLKELRRKDEALKHKAQVYQQNKHERNKLK